MRGTELARYIAMILWLNCSGLHRGYEIASYGGWHHRFTNTPDVLLLTYVGTELIVLSGFTELLCLLLLLQLSDPRYKCTRILTCASWLVIYIATACSIAIY